MTEVQVGRVGRLMPSVFSVDMGDNCLRSRNWQTRGKMAVSSPFPKSSPGTAFPGSLGPPSLLCRAVCPLFGVGEGRFLSSVSSVRRALGPSHSVRIQRGP